MKPARLPFYVGAPDHPGQLAGWYWIPHGEREPVALGSNAFMAHSALLTHLARNGIPDDEHDAA